MKRFLFVLALALLALTPVWAETPVTAVDSVEVFRSYVGNLDVVMLDLRLEAAYQGWKLNGAARGGHVAGAMDFPLSWLPLLDDAKLGEVLSQKGVAAGKTVVLYGAEKVDERLVAALNKKGVKRVVLFTLPSSRWTTDETIPMVSYPRYQLYVYPEWLKSLMDGGKPDNYDGRPFKVFECSWGEEKIAYLNGHIPGSVHINTDEFEEGPIWNQLSDERLRAAVAVNGITKDTLVVLYSAVQNMAAARIAWILMYCGVEDVRLLDGGFNAWKRAGLPIATESTPKTLAKEFGGKLPAHPELVIDTAAAKSILADPNGRLVSIRSWPEQIGETSGYGWLDRKGRIPGDVWGTAAPIPRPCRTSRTWTGPCATVRRSRPCGTSGAFTRRIGSRPSVEQDGGPPRSTLIFMYWDGPTSCSTTAAGVSGPTTRRIPSSLATRSRGSNRR